MELTARTHPVHYPGLKWTQVPKLYMLFIQEFKIEECKLFREKKYKEHKDQYLKW